MAHAARPRGPVLSRVIHVPDESMEPTLVDGCVMLVNRARWQRHIGRVYVVRTENGLIVKRAGKDSSGAWQLISDHPDKRTWPPIRWSKWKSRIYWPLGVGFGAYQWHNENREP